ncbi:ferredoxin reductase family protein [Rhodoluna lacicola]|uniref:Putative ferric reductase n=1 Tax=Rhodoluna lacicola TaxID=529884 RepID=A0A060JKS2_9MICO|nr:ferric reductase-like transmembrane domain-containing protein [Rhodoluna lacicola]AIC46884.1 putative ferric reductase [Rhodoluna lacicola]
MDDAPANQLRLSQPNKAVRIGERKAVRVKRAQDVIEVIAWSIIMTVLVMFLLDGGLKGVTDLPSALGAISRLTSLLGTALLLILLLLVARVPWIDKFYGHDGATVVHKRLGKPVLYLIVAHFLASLVQYSITNAKAIGTTLWWFITDVQDMLIATIGLALMIVVVLTSINFTRRKMSYEAWFFVHLTSYVSVALAVPHIFTAGSDVAGKPVQTTIWVALYLFVFLNILWFRVIIPIRKSFRKRLVLAQTVRDSSDTVSLYLTGKHLEKIEAVSGQFYFLRVLTPSQWWRPHPFSISAAPNGEYLRFTIGDRGDDTKLMQNIKPGTSIAIEGPYGLFTEERRTKEKVVLIASGIGIPPIRTLAESMAARPGDITVIYRVRNEADASLLSEIQEICRRREFPLHVIAGPRASKNSWLNDDGSNTPDVARLTVMAPHVSEADVYICGPEAWTHSVIKTVRKAGTPVDNIHSEEYAW